jgi:hypothetical protein
MAMSWRTVDHGDPESIMRPKLDLSATVCARSIVLPAAAPGAPVVPETG